jgi:hypothetical protein
MEHGKPHAYVNFKPYFIGQRIWVLYSYTSQASSVSTKYKYDVTDTSLMIFCEAHVVRFGVNK